MQAIITHITCLHNQDKGPKIKHMWLTVTKTSRTTLQNFAIAIRHFYRPSFGALPPNLRTTDNR